MRARKPTRVRRVSTRATTSTNHPRPSPGEEESIRVESTCAKTRLADKPPQNDVLAPLAAIVGQAVTPRDPLGAHSLAQLRVAMLTEAGVDPALLAGSVETLRAGLSATVTHHFAHLGVVQDSREGIDWKSRLEAAKLILSLIPQPRD